MSAPSLPGPVGRHVTKQALPLQGRASSRSEKSSRERWAARGPPRSLSASLVSSLSASLVSALSASTVSSLSASTVSFLSASHVLSLSETLVASLSPAREETAPTALLPARARDAGLTFRGKAIRYYIYICMYSAQDADLTFRRALYGIRKDPPRCGRKYNYINISLYCLIIYTCI